MGGGDTNVSGFHVKHFNQYYKILDELSMAGKENDKRVIRDAE
jgi:hypothetical protein